MAYMKITIRALALCICTLMTVALAGCVGAALQPGTHPSASTPAMRASGKMRVLTISGDWKSQPWYQDVWMQGGGQKLFRGRFIAREVEKAAPGKFEFTDITNYQAQAYGDANYFSQFDAIICGDILGYSLPARFHAGIKNFVNNGGGFLYAASWKWPTALLDNTPAEEILPARFGLDGSKEDWKNAESRLKVAEQNFKPVPALPDHAIVKNLDWQNVPTLDAAFQILPKDGADVLLKSPRGAPILATWNFGKGRSALSSSIWANDELSAKIGDWKDFGKYYAQMLSWLSENSARRAQSLKNATATATISINASGAAGNTVGAKLFSIHASHNDPNLAPLQGEALKNFQALNLEGGFTRLEKLDGAEAQNDDADPNHFNWPAFNFQSLDSQLAEMRRLKLEPIALFEINYGRPQWLWQGMDSTWDNPKPRAVEELAEFVAATVEHANGGKGGSPAYKLNLKYVEIGNEPSLTPPTIPGFARLVKGVAARIHRDYPGVQVGCGTLFESPYSKQILQAVNPDVDWISRHPYGWTGERAFQWQDELAAFQKQNHLREIPFLITEWDFWVQGKPKFDYMMTRYFEAMRRENLLGTLHFRLGQYNEPIYLFGVLWVGWGKEKGGGERGAPMHDAYDAFWLFRDFRGARVPASVSTPSDGLGAHLHADAVREGDKVNAVFYYDWAYDGTGFKDYAKGLNYAKVQAKIQIELTPSNRARVLTISRATGEGFQVLPQQVPIAAGQKTVEYSLELEPTIGWSLAIQ
jgi:uncharacterized membrane protein